jgi:hypothetical protein
MPDEAANSMPWTPPEGIAQEFQKDSDGPSFLEAAADVPPQPVLEDLQSVPMRMMLMAPNLNQFIIVEFPYPLMLLRTAIIIPEFSDGMKQAVAQNIATGMDALCNLWKKQYAEMHDPAAIRAAKVKRANDLADELAALRKELSA